VGCSCCLLPPDVKVLVKESSPATLMGLLGIEAAPCHTGDYSGRWNISYSSYLYRIYRIIIYSYSYLYIILLYYIFYNPPDKAVGAEPIAQEVLAEPPGGPALQGPLLLPPQLPHLGGQRLHQAL